MALLHDIRIDSQQTNNYMRYCRVPFILKSFDLYLDKDLFCRGHRFTAL
jgi:hypothetical protein